MNLTKEQQEIYDGKQGATLAKVMQTLVRYGELFGADGIDVYKRQKYGSITEKYSIVQALFLMIPLMLFM